MMNTTLVLAAVIFVLVGALAFAAIAPSLSEVSATGRPPCSTHRTNECGLNAKGQDGDHPPI